MLPTNRLGVVTLLIAPGSQDASRAPYISSKVKVKVKVKVMAKAMQFSSPAGLRLIEVFSPKIGRSVCFGGYDAFWALPAIAVTF